MAKRTNFSIIFALLILILVFGGLIFSMYYFFHHRPEILFSAQSKPAAEVFLPDDSVKVNPGSKLSDIPAWLFFHVAVIAALQVLSVLSAAMKARKPDLSSRNLAVIQFLIEIPMYLGLFGTLLGVCLTQFIAGTLVAPLAYVTTMNGILLHVFGKLTIWLALASDEIETD